MIEFTTFNTDRSWGRWDIKISLTRENKEENNFRVSAFAHRTKLIKTVSLFYTVTLTDFSDNVIKAIIDEAFETITSILQRHIQLWK